MGFKVESEISLQKRHFNVVTKWSFSTFQAEVTVLWIGLIFQDEVTVWGKPVLDLTGLHSRG